MPRLRLSTESRFILSGFSPKHIEYLSRHAWTVFGDVGEDGALVLVKAEPPTDGLTLSRDGRLHVARGQELHNVQHECELDVTEWTWLERAEQGPVRMVLTVTGKTRPTAEKLANMLARPKKLPPVDERAITLFEDLGPKRRKR